MPEEQEERMLRITETMVEEFGKWADDNGPMPEWVWYLYGNEFGKLEPVPKHTDEEYDDLDEVMHQKVRDNNELRDRVKELEVMAARYSALLEETDRQKARIEELEEERRGMIDRLAVLEAREGRIKELEVQLKVSK
jgi:DNA repair ATPase RecN